MTKELEFVRAVDGVSFTIKRGEVFGLAGETGSGKTTIGRLVLGLEKPTEGEVIFDGIDLTSLNPEELRQLRKRMQVIFQDPMASLNPRMSIGAAISPRAADPFSGPGQSRGQGETVKYYGEGGTIPLPLLL